MFAFRLLSIFKYGGEMGVLIGLYFVVAMMTAGLTFCFLFFISFFFLTLPKY